MPRGSYAAPFGLSDFEPGGYNVPRKEELHVGFPSVYKRYAKGLSSLHEQKCFLDSK